MRRLVLALFVFAIVADAHAQQDPKAKEVLDAMSEKYKQIDSYRVNFVNTMENKIEDIKEQYSGEILVKGDMFKLVIGDQEVYNDGETVYTYFKDVNEVNIDHFVPEDGDMTPVTIYNAYQDGYKYRYVEEVQEGPRKLHVVELQPKPGTEEFDDLIKIILEIDQSTKTLAYMEIQDKSGSVYSYKMSGFNPNVSVTDAMFKFNVSKHPGVEVVDLR